jgi:hypothetical protein
MSFCIGVLVKGIVTPYTVLPEDLMKSEKYIKTLM